MKTTDQKEEEAVVPPMMSDYEKLRAENIARNNARLRALGLISAREEFVSNHNCDSSISSKQNIVVSPERDDDEWHDDDDDDDDEDSSPLNAKPKKHRKRKKSPAAGSPSRKSRRLQDMEPEGGLSSDLFFARSSSLDPKERDAEREARVAECREQRLRYALEVSQLTGAAKVAAKENPTTTYAHCLMRVQTMTEKGLLNRVKAIERAAGKHCVIKMATFKSCCQDEGLWEIAESASQALERLKTLKPVVV